jgi:hypothetical protein
VTNNPANNGLSGERGAVIVSETGTAEEIPKLPALQELVLLGIFAACQCIGSFWWQDWTRPAALYSAGDMSIFVR